MKQHRSAGALVVSTDLQAPRTLLLDQVRYNGERQTVAPKGTLEPGESPLLAAQREVQEETGVTELTYAGYLGQQRYGFDYEDGTRGEKTVDWFLFATDADGFAPRLDEGFTSARWVPLDQAPDVASHVSFLEHLDRARDIVSWRRRHSLAFSRKLSDLMWTYSRDANAILAPHANAGIAACGSVARGDFVEGWSDVDLIGWRIPPDSPAVARLAALTRDVERDFGIHTSLRLADSDGRDASGAGPLYDMKLRATLRRGAIDVPVIAGCGTLLTDAALASDGLVEGIGPLLEFAVARLATSPDSMSGRIDRARRVLSVMCSAARNVAAALVPETSLRLPAVVAFLDREWPDTRPARLLTRYDAFRRQGATDITLAEELAAAVPDALEELRDLAGARRSGTEPAASAGP